MSQINCPLCANMLTDDEAENVLKKFGNIMDDAVKQGVESMEKKHLQNNKDMMEAYDERLTQKNKQQKEEIEELKNLQDEEIKRKVEEKIAQNNEEINETINKFQNKIIEYEEKERIDLSDKKRLLEQIEKLQEENRSQSSNLLGKKGEAELRDILTEKFPTDLYHLEGKGISEADIVQTIVYNNQKINPVICYDFKKNNKSWDNKWIEKAIKYKEIHKTEWSIIVAQVLPRPSSDHLTIQEVDGILIIHPYVVAEVVSFIRKGIIAINNLRLSQEDKDNKTAQLYDYIRSKEFVTTLENLYLDIRKLQEIAVTEKAKHNVWWASREKHHKSLIANLNHIQNAIENTLDLQLMSI